MLRLWLIVIAGNLLGAMISSVFLLLAEDVINAKPGFIEIGKHLVNRSLGDNLFSVGKTH
jgi:formate/nitrite transporter FocA (FNT family)